MDIPQLKYFQALARRQHMTQAAAELHVAQPALSRSLRTLEAELGCPLFDRPGKAIVLNENGAVFLAGVDAALGALEAAQRELAARTGAEVASVSLSMRAGSKLLPDLIRGFKARHPDIALQVIQQSGDAGHDDCDVTIFSSARAAKGPRTMALMEEDICLAMPPSNPLSTQGPLRLAQAKNEPFICLYKGKELRTLTDGFCRQAGFAPRIVLESDSPGTVRELIALGVGLAFIPKITWRGFEGDPNVALVEICEPRCARTVSMAWRAGGRTAAEALRSYLIEFFAGLMA